MVPGTRAGMAGRAKQCAQGVFNKAIVEARKRAFREKRGEA